MVSEAWEILVDPEDAESSKEILLNYEFNNY